MLRVLFVCTGNICRSPMGELMFPLFFYSNDIVADSAGIQGLPNSPIDPSSARLLAADNIDTQEFRSKRLTPQLALKSDLILCFTQRQRTKIIELAPRARSRTFQLNDFTTLCEYCRMHALISGDDTKERLNSILKNASLAQAHIPPTQDIDDPYRKDFRVFESAHKQIQQDIAEIASALEPTRGFHAH